MSVQQPAARSDTRERILKTAFQLFHEQGYNATGVSTILHEAGVNAGSMYHFFESKDDLLLQVLEFSLGYLGPAVMDPVEAKTADPVARIFALLDHYRSRLDRHGCRLGCPMGNMALEICDGNADARALVHRNFEHWIDRVAGWLDEGGDRIPPGVDRRQLARFVLTVMEGGVMQSRAAGRLEPFDAAVEALRDYLNRLGVREPGRPRPQRGRRASKRRAR